MILIGFFPQITHLKSKMLQYIRFLRKIGLNSKKNSFLATLKLFKKMERHKNSGNSLNKNLSLKLQP